jgi:hypothetical protein
MQFKDNDLRDIEQSILNFDDIFQKTIAVYMPSGKLHVCVQHSHKHLTHSKLVQQCSCSNIYSTLFHLTGGNTIKYHKLTHVSELMKRLGNLKHFDSNFYESDHRVTKGLHKMTSMRRATFMNEMVRDV